MDKLFEEGLKNDKFNWPEDLILHYLRLLCENKHKKKILKILDSNIQYPMSECLEIVTEYNIKSAIAKLEYKQGNLEKTFVLRYEVKIPKN